MEIAGIILSRKPWNDLGFSLIRSSFIMLLNVQESRGLNFDPCVRTYTIYRVVFVMIFCRICWCTDSNLYIDEISIRLLVKAQIQLFHISSLESTSIAN